MSSDRTDGAAGRHGAKPLPVLRVERGLVRDPWRPVLEGIELSLGAGEIFALLGPGGAGKSTLLTALLDRPLPAGWQREGSWTCAVAPERTFLLPQPKGGRRGSNGPREFIPRLPLLLLDEPATGGGEAERPFLAAVLRERAESGSAIVLVTHDLALARLVADRAALLVAGRLLASQPAREFFGGSADPLVTRFVAQGNVSLAPAPPPLPAHFRWILEQRLAGMGRPGLLGDEDSDLEAIAGAGIEIVVALNQEPIPQAQLRRFGLEGWHLPIRDMGVPAMAPMARLCRDIDRVVEQDRAVAVHCHAGLGRTGLVLASVLVWRGLLPAAAIATLRATGRAYVQNAAQEHFVERFAREIGQC